MDSMMRTGLLSLIALVISCGLSNDIRKANAKHTGAAKILTNTYVDEYGADMQMKEMPEIFLWGKDDAVEYIKEEHTLYIKPFEKVPFIQKHQLKEQFQPSIEFPELESFYTVWIFQFLVVHEMAHLHLDGLDADPDNIWDGEIRTNMLTFLFLKRYQSKRFQAMEFVDVFRHMRYGLYEKLQPDKPPSEMIAEKENDFETFLYVHTSNIIAAYEQLKTSELDAFLSQISE